MDRPRRRSSKSLEVIKNQEDLIQYFYKCMLTCIVDQWEEDIKNPSDYLPTSKKTFIYANKKYVQACNEAELENDEAAPSTEVEEHVMKIGSRTRATRFVRKSKRLEKTRSRKFSSFSKKSESFEEAPPSDLEDCVMIKFTNGNFYNGPVYKKRFHGRGKFRWTDGSTYVGEFLNGEMTGKGKFYFNDQSSYEGEVYQGFPHGYGKKFAPESPSAFCGQWRIGKKHGSGWAIFSEDNWYEGSWKTDKMHGNGVRCYPDGSKYQGNFHKGKRQGNGCAILWNNDIYVGQWVNGRRSGYGEYIWKAFLHPTFVIPVQNKYIGHWTKDRMHGKGELYFGSKNGARYVGQFYKNNKHGNGVVICDNGDTIQYDNIFANDKPIHFHENGSVEAFLHVADTCVDHCQRGFDKIEEGPNSKDAVYLQSDNNTDKKIFVLPTSDYGKETANYDLCQFKVLRNTSLRSFRLHINASGENINLEPHIRKLCGMIYDIPIDLKSNAEEEMVSYLYKEMLKTIVDKMEVTIPDSVDSIPSGDRCFIRANLNYKQACNDEELLEKDYEQESTFESILEGHTYVGKVPSKRRNTSISKQNRRLRRKSNRSKKKLTGSTTTTPKFSTLTTPSQLKYNLDDQEFEEYVVIKFKNGNVYMGPTYMKMFHGFGEYRWVDGTVYKGDFFNGVITGSGQFTYKDLSIYEGEVYCGYPHGYGKCFLRHSTVAYSGHWYFGLKQGTGCIYFNYNNWYEGSWKADNMHGYGTRYYASGSKYQGEFAEGKRHGNGFALLSNNDIYTGKWANGKRNGYGQYIWKPYRNYCFYIPARNIYNGIWKNDFMHGKGELNFGTLNGSRYIGHFCYNQKHGGGIIICENGVVFDCTPMFADNKPVQYSNTGELQSSECNDSTPPTLPSTPEKSTTLFPQIFEKLSIDSPRQIDEIKGVNSNFRIETKTFRFPSSIITKKTRAAINLCQLQFLRKPEKMHSIKIPLGLPPEDIDLNPFIRALLEMIHGCTPLETSDSFIVKPNSWEQAGVQTMTKTHLNYNYQEIYNIEEKALRRAIHINLRRLREIYKHYSLIGCLKNVTYDTLMNRLFLWQFYRDCKISEKGISISYIDVLLAEDSISFSESIHDPFENIYFWQFLTTLVKTAWEIYGSKTAKYVFEGRSILEGIFTKFLNEDIFPNAGHHLGSALFDYKDILPIKAAYNWYKSIEEPMTIKTFALNIFSLNKKETHHYEPIPKDFYVKTGTNITIGSNVVFLAEEEPKCCVGPKKEKILPLPRKCLKKKLYFLRELGRRLIYRKIKFVVPGIFMNKECFNHEYKLCFLEFYEIVLICTQHILKKKEFKFKKKVTKISEVNENVLLKIMSSKKSKQYRKTASHHSIGKRTT